MKTLTAGKCVRVRRLTGKNQNFDRIEGITGESLNDHYSQISTYRKYTVSQKNKTPNSCP